jgi:hypothetical protein
MNHFKSTAPDRLPSSGAFCWHLVFNHKQFFIEQLIFLVFYAYIHEAILHFNRVGLNGAFIAIQTFAGNQ